MNETNNFDDKSPKLEVSFTYYTQQGEALDVYAWAEEDYDDFDLTAQTDQGHYVVPDRGMILEASKRLERQARIEDNYK